MCRLFAIEFIHFIWHKGDKWYVDDIIRVLGIHWKYKTSCIKCHNSKQYFFYSAYKIYIKYITTKIVIFFFYICHIHIYIWGTYITVVLLLVNDADFCEQRNDMTSFPYLHVMDAVQQNIKSEYFPPTCCFRNNSYDIKGKWKKI